MLNKYLITCECGCGESIICYTGVNNLYLNFAIPQRNVFSRRNQKRKLTFAAMGSRKPIAKIIVSQRQLEEFAEYLGSLQLKNETKTRNVSKMRLRANRDKPHTNKARIDIEPERPNYSLSLIPTMGRAALLSGKIASCYDLVFNADETRKLQRQIERAIRLRRN